MILTKRNVICVVVGFVVSFCFTIGGMKIYQTNKICEEHQLLHNRLDNVEEGLANRVTALLEDLKIKKLLCNVKDLKIKILEEQLLVARLELERRPHPTDLPPGEALKMHVSKLLGGAEPGRYHVIEPNDEETIRRLMVPASGFPYYTRD